MVYNNTKNDFLVSFLISAFNEEKYVSACIDSCLTQTHENIEIVVVDDGSTDSTADVIKNRYAGDSRVKLVELPANQGKVNGFNVAFENSAGEYLTIMGADDICYPDRVAVSLDYISDRHKIICGNLDTIDEHGAIIEKSIVKNNYVETDFAPASLINDPKVYGGTILLERSLAEKIFPLDSRLTHEDWYIPVKASLHSDIKYVNKSFIGYRTHRENSSFSRYRHKTFIPYEQWLSLKTRNIFYYETIIQLVQQYNIDVNTNNIHFVLGKILLLTKKNRLNHFFKFLPYAEGAKSRALFLLHMFPYLIYSLFTLRRVAQYLVKKIAG